MSVVAMQQLAHALDGTGPWIPAVAVAGALALVIVVTLWRRSRPKEAAHISAVRALVAQGDHRAAGDLQLRHGNIADALNLYIRGKVHERAAFCAERLGHRKAAAGHAEAGGDFEGAGRLFRASGEFAEAARVYEMAGMQVEAARAANDDDPDASASVSSGGRLEAGERYRIGDRIGTGGMGCVYEAVDTVLERSVALKLWPETVTPDDTARRLFEREAKAAAALTHPHIVIVHDFGLMSGRPFVCMELVDGEPLSDMLEATSGAGLCPVEFFRVAEGLLKALSFAHERSTIHCDVKPANVLRSREGVIKLTDFGIAKLVTTQRDKKTMIVAGTPAYMAPEQFEGKGIGARTDLFSAAAMFYELLTARKPFDCADRSTRPIPPAHLRADIPLALSDMVMRALAVEPGRRPASAAEMLACVRGLPRQWTVHDRTPTRPRLQIVEQDEEFPDTNVVVLPSLSERALIRELTTRPRLEYSVVPPRKTGTDTV